MGAARVHHVTQAHDSCGRGVTEAQCDRGPTMVGAAGVQQSADLDLSCAPST